MKELQDLKDLPPKNIIVKTGKLSGRSTTIRNKVASNQSISDLVPPKVEEYITKNGLYR